MPKSNTEQSDMNMMKWQHVQHRNYKTATSKPATTTTAALKVTDTKPGTVILRSDSGGGAGSAATGDTDGGNPNLTPKPEPMEVDQIIKIPPHKATEQLREHESEVFI